MGFGGVCGEEGGQAGEEVRVGEAFLRHWCSLRVGSLGVISVVLIIWVSEACNNVEFEVTQTLVIQYVPTFETLKSEVGAFARGCFCHRNEGGNIKTRLICRQLFL